MVGFKHLLFYCKTLYCRQSFDMHSVLMDFRNCAACLSCEQIGENRFDDYTDINENIEEAPKWVSVLELVMKCIILIPFPFLIFYTLASLANMFAFIPAFILMTVWNVIFMGTYISEILNMLLISAIDTLIFVLLKLLSKRSYECFGVRLKIEEDNINGVIFLIGLLSTAHLSLRMIYKMEMVIGLSYPFFLAIGTAVLMTKRTPESLYLILVLLYYHWMEVIYALHSRKTRFIDSKALWKKISNTLGKFFYESIVTVALIFPAYKTLLGCLSILVLGIQTASEYSQFGLVGSFSNTIKGLAFTLITFAFDWFDTDVEAKLVIVFLFAVLNNTSNYLSLCLTKFKLKNYGRRFYFDQNPGNAIRFYKITDDHIGTCVESEANLFITDEPEDIINCPYSIFRNYFNYSGNVMEGKWEIPQNLLAEMSLDLFKQIYKSQGYLKAKLTEAQTLKLHTAITRVKTERARQCKFLVKNCCKIIDDDRVSKTQVIRFMFYLFKTLSLKPHFYFSQRVSSKYQVKKFEPVKAYCPVREPAKMLDFKKCDRKLTMDEMYNVYCDFFKHKPKKSLYFKSRKEFEKYFTGDNLPVKGNFKIINFLYHISNMKPSKLDLRNPCYSLATAGAFTNLKTSFQGKSYALNLIYSFWKKYSRIAPDNMSEQNLKMFKVLSKFKFRNMLDLSHVYDSILEEFDIYDLDLSLIEPGIIYEAVNTKYACIKKVRRGQVKKPKPKPKKAEVKRAEQEDSHEKAVERVEGMKAKIAAANAKLNEAKYFNAHKVKVWNVNKEFLSSIKALDKLNTCVSYSLQGKKMHVTWKKVGTSKKAQTNIKKRYTSYLVISEIN